MQLLVVDVVLKGRLQWHNLHDEKLMTWFVVLVVVVVVVWVSLLSQVFCVSSTVTLTAFCFCEMHTAGSGRSQWLEY